MAFPLAALASAAGGLGGGAGQAAAALTGLSAASGGLSSKFTEIVNVASRFVMAFDPAIVAELNRTFKALDAVIGQALRPVIVGAIDIVRGFGGAIMGLMRDIQPVIAKIVSAIATNLQPLFENWAEVLSALVPVFDLLADVVSGVLDIMGTYWRAIQPFVTMFIELGKQLAAAIFGTDLGGKVNDLFATIKHAIQEFAKNLILAVASLLKLMGATKTLDALIKGTQPRKVEDIHSVAAPQNAAFASLADVAKQLTLAAFTASAGGGAGKAKKPEDFLASIQDELKAIKDGQMSILSEQAQGMLNAMLDVKKGVEVVYNKVKDIYDKLPSASTLSGADEAAIDAKADEGRAKGGLKQYNPGKNAGFWQQLKYGMD